MLSAYADAYADVCCAQLAEYLHDPATYERWKNGENVVPPEMLRPIGKLY
jgi:hypothetical protein